MLDGDIILDGDGFDMDEFLAEIKALAEEEQRQSSQNIKKLQ